MITIKGWYEDQTGQRHILDRSDKSLTSIVETLLLETEFAKGDFEVEEAIDFTTQETLPCFIKEGKDWNKRIKTIVTALTAAKEIPGWRREDDRPYFS